MMEKSWTVRSQESGERVEILHDSMMAKSWTGNVQESAGRRKCQKESRHERARTSTTTLRSWKESEMPREREAVGETVEVFERD
jgi:hypothetical protein